MVFFIVVHLGCNRICKVDQHHNDQFNVFRFINAYINKYEQSAALGICRLAVLKFNYLRTGKIHYLNKNINTNKHV